MKFITSILRKSPPYIFSLVILLAICWLTLVPKPLPDTEIELFPRADKVVHFIMFGSFAGALFVDMMRAGVKRKAVVCAFIAAAVSSFFGIAVEYLQMAMDMGRSADSGDAIADVLGAVVTSAVFFFIDGNYFSKSDTRCMICTEKDSSELDHLKKVYMKSFPAAERREWSDIMHKSRDNKSPLTLTLVKMDSNPVGFITSWNLGDFIYIEHFVIDPALRNRGLGAKAIKEFCADAALPVVLETEPAGCGADAERRIRFYERVGFSPYSGFRYIQPSYGIGLPAVPLTLMSTDTSLSPEEISTKLHKIVYGQS